MTHPSMPQSTTSRVSRREALRLAAAGLASALPAPALSQAKGPRLAVVGGGFAGASCARELKALMPSASVTLIEANATFTALPMSNSVLVGLRELKAQQFSYEKLEAAGIDVTISPAEAIDPSARTVTLAEGNKLDYDRLVIAPGIGLKWNAIPGYDRAASSRMPHAYKDAVQIETLRRQLAELADGGTVVISVPVNPARCPPAPYERASLIAHYLKTQKPRCKLIVLDSKDNFSMQRLFQNAWKELYEKVLEYVPLSSGGQVASVDPASKTIKTDFESYRADVANIIPPQIAGEIAALAGVADRTGWCPVDPATFESRLHKNVHVIGDAAIAGAMPKSASAAQSAGKNCAAAIARLMVGKSVEPPTIASVCYSLIAPDYAVSLTGKYHPVGEQYLEIEGAGGSSLVDDPPARRKEEAQEAQGWFKTITGQVFG